MNLIEYALFFEEWPMCGCGDPESVVEFLAMVLETAQPPADPAAVGVPMFDRKRLAELIPDDALRMQYLYLLAAHGLEEHGSSVPGWRTEKGDRLLDAIHTYGLDVPGVCYVTDPDGTERAEIDR